MKLNMLTLITGASLAAALTLSAQTRYVASPGSKVKIDGTSNIHDWTVEGQVISGVMEVNPADLFKGAAGKVNASVDVKIPVRSLKSGKDTMDQVMQEHMSMDKYPMINYKLSELTVIKGKAGGPMECESKGDLVVSGATNKITMPVTITKEGEDKLKINGKINLKMTSFNIKPPQPALAMGLIKTGDDVKLDIEWIVKERKESK
jgi:polyisoprenoid-binding protein YceI